MKCDATLASSPFVHLFFFLLCCYVVVFFMQCSSVLLLLRDNDDENDLYPNVCEHVARKHNDFMMFFQHYGKKEKKMVNYSWIYIYTNEVPLLSNAIQHNHYYMNDHWDSVSFFFIHFNFQQSLTIQHFDSTLKCLFTEMKSTWKCVHKNTMVSAQF